MATPEGLRWRATRRHEEVDRPSAVEAPTSPSLCPSGLSSRR